MSYQEWVPLFGRSAYDPELKAKLASFGKSAPVLEREELHAGLEVADIVLRFTDEALFPDLQEEVGEGTGVLSGLTMFLRVPGVPVYTGPLPAELSSDDGQETVRKKLGPPDEANERRRWDQWQRENLLLNVGYSRDLAQIISIMIMLPVPGT